MGVYDLGHGVDQFNNQFGQQVAGCRLAAKNKRARRHIGLRIFFDPLVKCDDVQYIEMLTLVLVNALDLNVEKRIRIRADPGAFFEELGQPLFVLVFDAALFALKILLLGKRFQAAQFFQMGDPAVTNIAGNQIAEPRIA